MPTVYEDLDLPNAGTPTAAVELWLAGAGGRPIAGRVASSGKLITGRLTFVNGNGIDEQGIWSADLVSNADILPAGTTYGIKRTIGCDVYESYISVPVTGGAYEAFTLEADPLNTIDPSALSGHASDVDLHGGGIEVAYAEITTTVVVTGSGGGLTTAVVTGLSVVVPALARPVYLRAHVPVLQQTGGPAEASYGLFVSGSMGAFAALDVEAPPDTDTTTPRTVEMFYRIPPLTPGTYVVGATGTGGNLTTKVAASLIARASLRAVAA